MDLFSPTVAYSNYVNNHKKAVASKFLEYGVALCDELGADYNIVFDRIMDSSNGHDESKFSQQEFFQYAEKFYPNTPEEKRDEAYKQKVESDFEYAWLHHIHNNPHHPEYWVLVEDNGKTKVLDMPPEYIVEMICDWESFRKEDGTGGAYDYYYKANNKKEGLLSPHTRELLEKGLEVVK